MNFADPERALLLFDLICAEAQFHSAEMNVGVNTVLRHLVERLLLAEALDCEQLAVMNDMDVLHLLSHHRLTSEDTRRWLMQPHTIKVTRNPDAVVSDHPLIVDLDDWGGIILIGPRSKTDRCRVCLLSSSLMILCTK
ncbi:hypothetical protein [Paenibacillus dendritiformis]|uniref:hypothetical protein n=1 Tax=Paenibacillus dendritiformis TaxID=130049 RepID=UPI00387E1047